MPGDDLFDDLDPADAAKGGSDDAAKDKPAAGGASDAGGDDRAAPGVEVALGQLAQGFQQVNETLRTVNSRMDRIEKGAAPPERPAASGKGSDVLTELMEDPSTFIESRVSGVVKKQLEALVPFLETMADGVTTSAKERARERFDSDMGTGAFDKLVGEDLDRALAELPAASRARGDYVQALVAGILGGKMMSDTGRKQVAETVRKAREAARPPAPVLLSGGGRAPAPRDRITDDERTAIDSLRRSGIEFSEKAFLDAKSRGNTEEDWGADWSKSSRYWEGPDKKTADDSAPEAT